MAHVQTQLAAVIGSPVAHSLSPVLHNAAYSALGLTQWAYRAIDLTPQELPELLKDLRAPVDSLNSGPTWAGLSVTMPHKQAILPLLDVVDPLAQTVGAANTVIAQRSGKAAALLAGFNTDVAGIVAAVREVRPQLPSGAGRAGGQSALVLGSGATACSALAALTELGYGPITVAARNHAGPGRALSAAKRMGLEIETISWQCWQPDSDAQIANLAARAYVVISTLPSGVADGLAPHLAALKGTALAPAGVLLDVAYNPWPSALAAAWQQAGSPAAAVAPGWLMLLHQAVAQVRLMTGQNPPVEPMRTALEASLEAKAQAR